MNKAILKSYAPQARLDFIAAVTARANLLGISSKGVSPTDIRGDVTIIDGREWPVRISGARDKLIELIKRHGFEQAMEEVAYTWFNRFAALRYMEIHDYFDHGWRVLSSRNGGLPEILSHASKVSLHGLNAVKVVEMQLAGTRDDELYRMLLVAQCNELSRVMPFLFERIDDLSELLLPDNLLRTDSIISKLVTGIPEEDWQEIEIIGWLYQFYISEKKQQVIGKVIKRDEIPAATQLFTPNWIVQYLVQNTLGRLWLTANPQSELEKKWPYYIKPAEQSQEAQTRIRALIQARVHDDGESLNPETITLLDPACGSGHILVVAYDVLKDIYLERGYQIRSIPRIILEKNIYGLDIDDRAAQLAGFALLMKARADDRRLFANRDEFGNIKPPQLNVISLQESKSLNSKDLSDHLMANIEQRNLITELIKTFEDAKTFGSLIRIPTNLASGLVNLKPLLEVAIQGNDLYARAAADELFPFVRQAQVLATRFDSVAANPPYMGAKSFTAQMKIWLKDEYPSNDKDLFSAFIERSAELCRSEGHYGIMTSFVWMFIASFESLRNTIINNQTINSLIQLHYDAFADAKAHICTFVNQPTKIPGYKSSYIRLADFPGVDIQSPKTLEAVANKNCGWFYEKIQDEFNIIPGSPIAYWLKNTRPFAKKKLSNSFISGGRTKTHDNQKYLRYWWELSNQTTRWSFYATSGDFRKYYGNLLQVVDWSIEARMQYQSHGGLYPEQFWQKEGITWGKITSTRVSFRLKPDYAHYDSGAGTIFSDDFRCDDFILGYLNSPIVDLYLKAMNPTVNTTVNDVFALPMPDREHESTIKSKVNILKNIALNDWNEFEISRDFRQNPLIGLGKNISTAYANWIDNIKANITAFKSAEEHNNNLFIESMGIESDVKPTVPIEQISLTTNFQYRYGIEINETDGQLRFKRDTSAELISYAIGCMMGRYSLDEPGLIYAHSSNIGFDLTRYATFPADADGILPLTDEHWFSDDAANHMREFLKAVWGEETLEKNIAWLAESIGQKSNETPEEAVRRYLSDKFFKDHLQTYKKRPIYWLFSSGKQGAFQALVYVHRYNESTLARMRAEYVVPMTSKMASRLEMIEKDAAASGSTSARAKLLKQAESLRKKQSELLVYDEKLRHYADMRIKIDLDDGVKINYAKFGDLVAESKAITGGSDE